MNDAASADKPIGKQLVRQAEAIARLRKDLDRMASDLTETVSDLASRIEGIESESDAPGHQGVMAWCWRYLGPRGSESLWRELDSWVSWIRHRYPLARRIPPCWAQHTELVEELTALWLAWNAAYTERGASLTAAIDWHDRWLPGLLYRLEHGAFAHDCSGGHQDRPASAYAEAIGADAFVPNVAATAGP